MAQQTWQMAQHTPPTTTSTEHIPAGEHKGGFPPFDVHTFPSQLVWLVIVFVVLYTVMARVALPQIGSILENRRKQIEGDLATADRLKGESEAALAAYQKALADARNRAQTIASETREQQAAEADKARRALEDELNTKLAAAEKSIAATRAAAMGNVEGIASEAAAAIVTRLVGTAPAAEDVKRAVGESIRR